MVLVLGFHCLLVVALTTVQDALIKKHVKAPAYIIIGPELSSNGRNTKKCGNLFKKRVGIQLWTDELYERLLSKKDRINEGIKE